MHCPRCKSNGLTKTVRYTGNSEDCMICGYHYGVPGSTMSRDRQLGREPRPLKGGGNEAE